MTGHALSVRRLRFRGRVANSLATRGRVEMALAAGASRLGNEAILCVRRIAIALPRVDNLPAALDAEISNAARPARAAVPANANAILFADRAELLACLARDWCAGDATARWWWPVLFPRDDFAAIVRRAWLEDARSVPAALDRLESVGLAAQFLTKLAPPDVATLWRTIVHTFHLAPLDAAWSAIKPALAPLSSGSGHRAAAPWAPWLTVDPSLAIDVARVVVTAMLLERAPAKARSVAFAREVRAWRPLPKTYVPSESESGNRSSFVDATRKDQTPDREWAVRNAPPLKAQWMPVARSNGEPAANQRGLPPTQAHQSSRDSRMPEDRARSTRLEERAPITASAAATGETVGSQSRANSLITSSAPSVDESVALPPVALPDRITSQWGGILYLVNVAIALELYGDFTTPARPGLALPLWDFLALVGERMIGEEFAEDPLPGLFAKLSGRAVDELAGVDFEAPTGEPFTIWLERTCHDLQVRIAASLGLGPDCDLRALVLNHHAKIETNSERLDAYFSLAEHPVELRVAGLDRDPGWVPAGGRNIYFHYD